MARLLAAVALALMTPLFPASAYYDPTHSRLPVAPVFEPTSSASTQGDFDSVSASRRVVEGVVERLRAKGFAVRPSPAGDPVAFLSVDATSTSGSLDYAGADETSEDLLILSVAFPSSTIPQASGTETHFGGRGDEAWRLASRVQRHLTSGLRDVMAYPSFDRGIVEHDGDGAQSGRPDWLGYNKSWVEAYPLFATNKTERTMLETPGTLELLSTALANAVADYLSPAMITPPRDPRYGWRQLALSDPVIPKLVLDADPSPRVALTFDAASWPPFQPAILDELSSSGVRCTIFLTGDFVDKFPDLVVRMVEDGHEIGNHSDTHPDMRTNTAAEIVSELEDFDAKIIALTGRSTRPWFRPPSGYYNDLVVEVAAQRGYHTIYWSADSADWRPDVDAETVKERWLRYATPGAILVGHLTSPQTARVLPDVIRTLKARGVEFGTLTEIMPELN